MAITTKQIQELRDRTGVGIMDCKKALTESDGNMDKAIELLREKGMASAAKRAGKIASQGVVASYIHMGGKIGVLVEVNCESDFVARGEAFNNFVHDIAMQIAASAPAYVNKEEVSAEEIAKEKEILKQQAMNDEKNKNKPEAIIEKMIEGRIGKYYKEVCLLEQPFFKNHDITVTDYLHETVAKIGEKIDIRRFVRFVMGEGLAKKEENLAKEVEEQIAAAKANN